MASDSNLSVLRRMAGARPATQEAAPVSSGEGAALLKALATALLRVADAMGGLGLSVTFQPARRVDAADAFAEIADHALCLPLDPPGAKADPPTDPRAAEIRAAGTGILTLDPAFTDALIEVQTIGQVDGAGRPSRRPTRIDAALAQPFLRSVLDQLDALLPEGEDPRPGGLRAGTFVAGPGSLRMVATAAAFLRFDLDVTLGDGAREAKMVLVLPERATAAVTAPPPSKADDWQTALDAAVLSAPVRLEALLPAIRLPLARLVSLKVGDIVELDANALSAVTLHGGSSGITIPGRRRGTAKRAMTARLGQLHGTRAVKISGLPGEVGTVVETAPRSVEDALDAPDLIAAGAAVSPAADAPAPGATTPDPSAAPVPATASNPDLPDPAGLPDLPDLPDLPEIT